MQKSAAATPDLDSLRLHHLTLDQSACPSEAQDANSIQSNQSGTDLPVRSVAFNRKKSSDASETTANITLESVLEGISSPQQQVDAMKRPPVSDVSVTSAADPAVLNTAHSVQEGNQVSTI